MLPPTLKWEILSMALRRACLCTCIVLPLSTELRGQQLSSAQTLYTSCYKGEIQPLQLIEMRRTQCISFQFTNDLIPQRRVFFTLHSEGDECSWHLTNAILCIFDSYYFTFFKLLQLQHNIRIFPSCNHTHLPAKREFSYLGKPHTC